MNDRTKSTGEGLGAAGIGIIALVAGLYRGFHLYFWSRTPWFRLPSLDEIYHHNWANYIAEGHLLFPTAFFRAPFYAYFLGVIYAIFGTNPWAVRIVQMLIGVVGCVLVAILAYKVFGDRRVGFLAGIFMALSPMPALFESRLLLDWMLIPLGAGVLIFLVDAARSGKGRDIFFFGLFAGLFAITRPNILAVFPFLLLWLVLKANKKWLKVLGLALLGIVLPILPATVHNVWRGDASLIATQGGLNLYLGNNAETDGVTPVLPGHGGTWTVREAWRIAESVVGHELSASEMSDWYFDRAIDFAMENPGDELRLLGKKVGLLFSPVQHGNNGSPEFFKRYSPVLESPFAWGLFLIFAAASIPAVFRRKNTAVLILWFVLYGSTIVLFFVNARFRLPLLVAAVPLASAGVMLLYDLLKSRRFKQFVLHLILPILILAAFLFVGNEGLTDRGTAESYLALGNIYLRQGEMEKADSLFAKASNVLPAIDRAYLNRGIIAFEWNKYSLARDYFEREIGIGGEVSDARSNLGVIARLQGDTASALRQGKLAIEVDPFNTQAYVNYVRSLVDFGYADSALEIAKVGLELDSLNRRLLLSAGAASMELGDIEKAEQFFLKASRESAPEGLIDYELADIYSVEGAGAAPDSVIRGYALYNLGLIEASRGDYGSALVYFGKSLELNPENARGWASYGGLLSQLGKDEQAENALKRAIENGYNSPEAYFNLGLINARKGNYNAALAYFEQAVKIEPEFVPAIEKIDLIKKLANEGKISLENY